MPHFQDFFQCSFFFCGLFYGAISSHVERKIIRRIYGPVMENNVWRISSNEELNTLLKGEDIVKKN
jgi:hypothetical protein